MVGVDPARAADAEEIGVVWFCFVAGFGFTVLLFLGSDRRRICRNGFYTRLTFLLGALKQETGHQHKDKRKGNVFSHRTAFIK